MLKFISNKINFIFFLLCRGRYADFAFRLSPYKCFTHLSIEAISYHIVHRKLSISFIKLFVKNVPDFILAIYIGCIGAHYTDVEIAHQTIYPVDRCPTRRTISWFRRDITVQSSLMFHGMVVLVSVTLIWVLISLSFLYLPG